MEKDPTEYEMLLQDQKSLTEEIVYEENNLEKLRMDLKEVQEKLNRPVPTRI